MSTLALDSVRPVSLMEDLIDRMICKLGVIISEKFNSMPNSISNFVETTPTKKIKLDLEEYWNSWHSVPAMLDAYYKTIIKVAEHDLEKIVLKMIDLLPCNSAVYHQKRGSTTPLPTKNSFDTFLQGLSPFRLFETAKFDIIIVNVLITCSRNSSYADLSTSTVQRLLDLSFLLTNPIVRTIHTKVTNEEWISFLDDMNRVDSVLKIEDKSASRTSAIDKWLAKCAPLIGELDIALWDKWQRRLSQRWCYFLGILSKNNLSDIISLFALKMNVCMSSNLIDSAVLTINAIKYLQICSLDQSNQKVNDSRMKSENSAIYRLRATLEQLKNWIDRPLNNNVLVLVLDTMAKMIKQVSFYSPESRSSLHNDYSALFKEVLVPLYTKANDFSTKSELKVHSLRLMACILTSAPRDFFDSNFDSWLNKRVLAHLGEDKKAKHCLELLLLILQGSFEGPTPLELDSILLPYMRINGSSWACRRHPFAAICRSDDSPIQQEERLTFIFSAILKKLNKLSIHESIFSEILQQLAIQNIEWAFRVMFPPLLKASPLNSVATYHTLKILVKLVDQTSQLHQYSLFSPFNFQLFKVALASPANNWNKSASNEFQNQYAEFVKSCSVIILPSLADLLTYCRKCVSIPNGRTPLPKLSAHLEVCESLAFFSVHPQIDDIQLDFTSEVENIRTDSSDLVTLPEDAELEQDAFTEVSVPEIVPVREHTASIVNFKDLGNSKDNTRDKHMQMVSKTWTAEQRILRDMIVLVLGVFGHCTDFLSKSLYEEPNHPCYLPVLLLSADLSIANAAAEVLSNGKKEKAFVSISSISDFIWLLDLLDIPSIATCCGLLVELINSLPLVYPPNPIVNVSALNSTPGGPSDQNVSNLSKLLLDVETTALFLLASADNSIRKISVDLLTAVRDLGRLYVYPRSKDIPLSDKWIMDTLEENFQALQAASICRCRVFECYHAPLLVNKPLLGLYEWVEGSSTMAVPWLVSLSVVVSHLSNADEFSRVMARIVNKLSLFLKNLQVKSPASHVFIMNLFIFYLNTKQMVDINLASFCTSFLQQESAIFELFLFALLYCTTEKWKLVLDVVHKWYLSVSVDSKSFFGFGGISKSVRDGYTVSYTRILLSLSECSRLTELLRCGDYDFWIPIYVEWLSTLNISNLPVDVFLYRTYVRCVRNFAAVLSLFHDGGFHMNNKEKSPIDLWSKSKRLELLRLIKSWYTDRNLISEFSSRYIAVHEHTDSNFDTCLSSFNSCCLQACAALLSTSSFFELNELTLWLEWCIRAEEKSGVPLVKALLSRHVILLPDILTRIYSGHTPGSGPREDILASAILKQSLFNENFDRDPLPFIFSGEDVVTTVHLNSTFLRSSLSAALALPDLSENSKSQLLFEYVPDNKIETRSYSQVATTFSSNVGRKDGGYNKSYKIFLAPINILATSSLLDSFQPYMQSLVLLSLFYLQHPSNLALEAFGFLTGLSVFFTPADFRPSAPIVSQLTRFKSAIATNDVNLRRICALEISTCLANYCHSSIIIKLLKEFLHRWSSFSPIYGKKSNSTPLLSTVSSSPINSIQLLSCILPWFSNFPMLKLRELLSIENPQVLDNLFISLVILCRYHLNLFATVPPSNEYSTSQVEYQVQDLWKILTGFSLSVCHSFSLSYFFPVSFSASFVSFSAPDTDPVAARSLQVRSSCDLTQLQNIRILLSFVLRVPVLFHKLRYDESIASGKDSSDNLRQFTLDVDSLFISKSELENEINDFTLDCNVINESGSNSSSIAPIASEIFAHLDEKLLVTCNLIVNALFVVAPHDVLAFLLHVIADYNSSFTDSEIYLMDGGFSSDDFAQQLTSDVQCYLSRSMSFYLLTSVAARQFQHQPASLHILLPHCLLNLLDKNSRSQQLMAFLLSFIGPNSTTSSVISPPLIKKLQENNVNFFWSKTVLPVAIGAHVFGVNPVLLFENINCNTMELVNIELLVLLVSEWTKSRFDNSVLRMCGMEALKTAFGADDMTLSILALKLYGCILSPVEPDDILSIGKILVKCFAIGQKEWKSTRPRGSYAFRLRGRGREGDISLQLAMVCIQILFNIALSYYAPSSLISLDLISASNIQGLFYPHCTASTSKMPVLSSEPMRIFDKTAHACFSNLLWIGLATLRCALPPIYDLALRLVRVVVCHPIYSMFLHSLPQTIVIAAAQSEKEAQLSNFMFPSTLWLPKFTGMQHLILRGMLFEESVEDSLQLLLECWLIPNNEFVDIKSTRTLMNLTIILPWLYFSINAAPSKLLGSINKYSTSWDYWCLTLSENIKRKIVKSSLSDNFSDLVKSLTEAMDRESRNIIFLQICECIANAYLPHESTTIAEILSRIFLSGPSKYQTSVLNVATIFLNASNNQNTCSAFDKLTQICLTLIVDTTLHVAAENFLSSVFKVSPVQSRGDIISENLKQERRLAVWQANEGLNATFRCLEAILDKNTFGAAKPPVVSKPLRKVKGARDSKHARESSSSFTSPMASPKHGDFSPSKLENSEVIKIQVTETTAKIQVVPIPENVSQKEVVSTSSFMSPRNVANRDASLNRFLHDPALVPIFQNYVETHFDCDGLNFYLAAHDYSKEENPQKAKAIARVLIKLFIELDSVDTVSIDELTRNEILQIFNSTPQNVPLPTTLFSRAMQEVKAELISYIYPSFASSDEFRELVLQDEK